MVVENLSFNEIIVMIVACLVGVFMVRARFAARPLPKKNPELEKYEDEELLRIHNLDDDLKKISAELEPHLHEAEKYYGGTQSIKPKPALKLLKPESEAEIARRPIDIEAEKLAKPLVRESKLISLEEALKSTKSGIMGRIKGLFSSKGLFDANDLESIEEVLYTSDLGPQTVQRLVSAVSTKIQNSEVKDIEIVRGALRDEMVSILAQPQKNTRSIERYFAATERSINKPEVWMVVGVNGAGKTTTIGKLAYKLALSGKTVMIAAGDTFRAAASEQLKVWSERAKVEIFAPEGVESPSAVAFDAVKYAIGNNFDHLIVDTAGRLHTQKNLMDELKKVKRVIEKAFDEAKGAANGTNKAPHEVLLVLDANSGQNALIQAREFHQALGVSGIVLTKLDGTAKGGVAVGISEELGIPIQLIGVGEGKDDLRGFKPIEFVDAIV